MDLYLFSIGGIPITIHFYGLMYALSFICAYFWLDRQEFGKAESLERAAIILITGLILGGRLGYILFYNLSYYLEHPIKIFALYEGGMSFHGGLIGVILATVYIACRFPRQSFLSGYTSQRAQLLHLLDTLAVISPLGIGLGRLANYFNGELYGYAPYSGPFAMMRGGVAHFPSPLLEMLLEGIILGGITYTIWRYIQKKGSLHIGLSAGVFIGGYTIARICAEFVRLPDAHIGYIAFGFITVGQILTLLIALLGGALLYVLKYGDHTSHHHLTIHHHDSK